MFEKYHMGYAVFARKWRDRVFYLTVLLLILFSFSSRAIADAQPDHFAQSLGFRLQGTEGDIQTLIDQLSKRLLSEPYRAELYYHLARAYTTQGWHDKAAQYMGQWIKSSNTDVIVRGSHAYILDEKNDEVLVIDTTTKQVVRKIHVGWLPKKMIPTPDGSKLYVTNALANNVSAINTEKMAVAKTIKAGRMPWNGKSGPQGDRVYVANLKSDDVSVIDTKNDTVLETVKVGHGPWGIAVSSDGHRLYVSNQDSRSVQVIDTGSYSIVDVISVGVHPRDIALAPDGEKKLYALDEGIVGDAVEVYVIDLEDTRIVDAMNVPATDDPLLSRVEKMSFQDKIELLASLAASGEETGKRIKKLGMGSPPGLAIAARSSIRSVRPVSTKNAITEPVKLPVGGPMPLMGSEPVVKAAYVKIPPASDGKPLPLQESKPTSVAAKLPTGDSAAFMGPESVTEVYVKLPPASSGKSLSPQKPEPTPGSPKLPMDDPAALVKPEPVVEAYANVPSTSSRKPLPLPESEPAAKSEVDALQKSSKQEKRVLRIIIVVRNDTLWRISTNNYGMANNSIIKAVQAANPAIKDVSKIYEGQKIKLPEIDVDSFSAGKTLVVKPNDSLFRIALNHYGTISDKIYAAILEANPHIKHIDKIMVGQRIMLPDLPDIASRPRA